MALTMGAWNVLECGMKGGDPKLSPSSAPTPPVCSFTEAPWVFVFPLFNQKVLEMAEKERDMVHRGGYSTVVRGH